MFFLFIKNASQTVPPKKIKQFSSWDWGRRTITSVVATFIDYCQGNHQSLEVVAGAKK